jgi:hypothetical protein
MPAVKKWNELSAGVGPVTTDYSANPLYLHVFSASKGDKSSAVCLHMPMMIRFRLLAVLLSILACFAARPAHAACSSPAGTETQIMYNQDYHTFQFCNGTAWMSMSGGGGPGSGPMSLISTQTASASASLQFTNLPSSYNTLFLDCNDIVTGTGNLELQFGEGATPTWETASYKYSYSNRGSTNTVGGGASNSAAGIFISGGAYNGSNAAQVVTAKVYINNVGDSSFFKQVVGISTSWDGAGVFYPWILGGAYVGDHNAITGLKVLLTDATNMTSGQCRLYGMN